MPWNKDGTRKKSAFYLRSGNSPLFKIMGSSPGKSPLKQSWSSTNIELKNIRKRHLSTLKSFRDAGLKDSNSDVRSVISKLEQVDRDIMAHGDKALPGV
jgi:hypothetical protein